MLRQGEKLLMVGDQRLGMLLVVRGGRGIAGGRMAERAIEMRFRHLEERWRRQQQALCGRRRLDGRGVVAGEDTRLELSYPIPTRGHRQNSGARQMALE